MTSRSRRNRPTTPSPSTGRRTGISLAAAAALALSAAASDPAPVGPAPTRWAATPTTPTPPTVPARLPVTPVKPPAPPAPTGIPVPPPPAAATPSRVVVFQKPAGAEGTAPAIPIAPAVQKNPEAPAPRTTAPSLQPGQKLPPAIDDPKFALTPTTVLSRDKVFQLTSDEELRRRIARELYEEELERQKRSPDADRKVSEENYRPPLVPPVGAGVPYQMKALRYSYPLLQTPVEPHYVVHRRLLFEERNAERYGWDAGIVQPLLSTAYFYKDVLLWPSKLASNPFERYDTSAGKCLPGDPVPYFLYPPEIDLFGGSVGAGAIVGAVFLFP